MRLVSVRCCGVLVDSCVLEMLNVSEPYCSHAAAVLCNRDESPLELAYHHEQEDILDILQVHSPRSWRWCVR